MRELDLEKSVLDAISTTLIGEKVEVRFAGLATPVAVRMRFAGGWEVMYTIVPGMALEFVRGEDGYLNALSVTLLRYEGPEQQI